MRFLRRFKPFGIGWIILHAIVIAGTFAAGFFTRFN